MGKSVFKRLMLRLDKDYNISANKPKRLYPGYWQRAAGAWVWSANILGTTKDVGSIFTASEILKAKKIGVRDDGTAGIDLFPIND